MRIEDTEDTKEEQKDKSPFKPKQLVPKREVKSKAM